MQEVYRLSPTPYAISFKMHMFSHILLNNMQVRSLNILGHTSVLGKTQKLHAAAQGRLTTKDEI